MDLHVDLFVVTFVDVAQSEEEVLFLSEGFDVAVQLLQVKALPGDGWGVGGEEWQAV